MTDGGISQATSSCWNKTDWKRYGVFNGVARRSSRLRKLHGALAARATATWACKLSAADTWKTSVQFRVANRSLLDVAVTCSPTTVVSSEWRTHRPARDQPAKAS